MTSPRILIIGNRFDPHGDQMLEMLREVGVACARWIDGTFPLETSLTLRTGTKGYEGELDFGDMRIDLSEVRSVWYRGFGEPALPKKLKPDERKFAEREVWAALAGLFRAFDWFWINHPEKVRIANSKVLQLKTAAELGFRIPATLVTNDPAQVREFFKRKDGNIVYKPFNSGFFAGTQRVCYTTPLGEDDLDHIDMIKSTPGIFQEKVAKQFELRVTAIGPHVFATEIQTQSNQEARDDWRGADIDSLPHAPHRLPEQVEAGCREFLKRMGLVYGAMDFIYTPEGEYVFLENNPTGQCGWIEIKTGEPLTATLARMLIAGEVV